MRTLFFFCCLLLVISCNKNELVGTWKADDIYSISVSNNNVIEIKADSGMSQNQSYQFNYELKGDSIHIYRNDFDCLNFWCKYQINENQLHIEAFPSNLYFNEILSKQNYNKVDTTYTINDSLGYFRDLQNSNEQLDQKYFGEYVGENPNDTLFVWSVENDIFLKFSSSPYSYYELFKTNKQEWIAYVYCNPNYIISMNKNNFNFILYKTFGDLNSYHTTVDFKEGNNLILTVYQNNKSKYNEEYIQVNKLDSTMFNNNTMNYGNR